MTKKSNIKCMGASVVKNFEKTRFLKKIAEVTQNFTDAPMPRLVHFCVFINLLKRFFHMATVKQFNPSSLNLPFSILREDPFDYSHTSSKVNSLKDYYDLLRSQVPDDAQPFFKSLDNERERSFWLSNHYSGDWYDHLSDFTNRRLNHFKSIFSNALVKRARVREDL